MGRWSCDQVYGAIIPYDTAGGFGSHVTVWFKMTYHPSLAGRFVEMPRLVWGEKIVMIEHHLQRRWQFEVDMYRHNPTSKTLVIWRNRYLAAYDAAGGMPRSDLGSSRLLDKMGHPVRASQLAQAADPNAKTGAVQDYLKGNGGSLLIGIHDRPSINMPKTVASGGPSAWEHKERLLLFRCSVGNGGPYFIAMQYLNVDGAQPKTSWGRSEHLSWLMPDLSRPPHYAEVPAPPHVSMARTCVPLSGEVD